MLILEFLVKRIAQGLLIVFITSLIIFTLLRVQGTALASCRIPANATLASRTFGSYARASQSAALRTSSKRCRR